MAPDPDEVHLWLARQDLPPEEVARLGRWLSRDERERAAAFRRPEDGQRFTVSRGLLRGLLGRYLDTDPAGLQFEYGPHGKPWLRGSGMEFSVSHAGDLALFAFTRGLSVGVDLEPVRPQPSALRIAARYFAPEEAERLHAFSRDELDREFFRLWTLKEAYVKARSLGIQFGLGRFAVGWGRQGPRLLRVEGEPGAPADWMLAELRPAEGYVGAVAAWGAGTRVVWRGDAVSVCG